MERALWEYPVIYIFVPYIFFGIMMFLYGLNKDWRNSWRWFVFGPAGMLFLFAGVGFTCIRQVSAFLEEASQSMVKYIERKGGLN